MWAGTLKKTHRPVICLFFYWHRRLTNSQPNKKKSTSLLIRNTELWIDTALPVNIKMGETNCAAYFCISLCLEGERCCDFAARLRLFVRQSLLSLLGPLIDSSIDCHIGSDLLKVCVWKLDITLKNVQAGLHPIWYSTLYHMGCFYHSVQITGGENVNM